MPKVYNTSGAKPGSIYRIALENFVTYKEVELYPGPCLNMIIGPNGSGKSTFVSAIILGLCGKIQSIRGSTEKNTQLSKYVRSGCNEARIEIELYQECKKENVIITRVINQKNESKWAINRERSSQTTVLNLIKKFNIQVDNLCQMLPQHRVKDFAQMTPHNRLISTLEAVGEDRRVAQLEEFKDIKSQHKNLFDKVQKNEQKKQELIKQNESLKLKIDILTQRKQIDKEIKMCECKKLWIEEADLRDKCRQYENDKKAAEKIVKSHGNKVKPLEDSMKNVNREIDRLEGEILETSRSIEECKEKIGNHLQSVKLQKDNIEDSHNWYLEQEKREEYNKKELLAAKNQLDKLKMDRTNTLEKYGDDKKLRVDLENLNRQINALTNEIMSLTSEKDDVQSSENKSAAEMQRCRENITRLQSVEQKRMRMLEVRFHHTAKALHWLQNNRGRFQGEVCGPMVLEIQLRSARYARYLEATVARRDLLAFCFSNSSDMNMFLQVVRTEMGLDQVNAVCCPQQQDTTAPDISQIRDLGFETYLVDTFTAPDMVVKFLCKNYRLHKIPVGNDYTYKNSNRVPDNIRLFFSESHRFSVRVSAYSRERSTVASVVQQAVMLADTVDVEQINRWNARLSECETKRQEDREKRKHIENKISTVQEKHNALDNKRKEIKKHLQLIEHLSVNIVSATNNVRRLEARPATDLVCARRERDARIRECVLKQRRLHADLLAVLRHTHELVAGHRYTSMKLGAIRNSIGAQEEKLRELKNNFKKAQSDLEKLLQLERNAKTKAREKLEEAKRSSNNKDPRDPRFPLKDIYDSLPDDLEALQIHSDELEAKISCMSKSDEQDVTTYENNKRLIEKLTEEMNSLTNEYRGLDDRIRQQKEEWVLFVKKLLAIINGRFSKMFAKLGCAGEVQLKTGASEDDFQSYGVDVLVQFRENQQLNALTAHTQSGGERALSTALYLLALQRHGAAPFRCVDEINQGMDATNERNVFNLLVKETTQEKGQYFLLTPNLLPNLEYNHNIMVHTIMNGKAIINYDRWNMETFIRNLRSH